LNNKAIVAVGIAIVIGIAGFILLFLSYPTSTTAAASATNKDGSLRFSILDLQETYAIDEPVNFSVHIKGYGYYCSGPVAKILGVDSRQLVYDIPERDVFVYCLPEPRDIEDVIRLEDMMSPYRTVILGEPGRYVLVVEFGGAAVEKEFAIHANPLAS
jgi:hypothetical protein